MSASALTDVSFLVNALIGGLHEHQGENLSYLARDMDVNGLTDRASHKYVMTFPYGYHV